MDGLIKEGFISRKLAKTDKNKKAKTVLQAWCSADSIPDKNKALKKLSELEKQANINQELHMPYNILILLAVVDYPQNKFDKIAKKCDDINEYIDYKWLLWADEDAPDYESKKNAAEKLWKYGQYKIIGRDGGGNYLIYSLRNGKFFDYFHEEDTAENLSWLKSGVTYKDAINQVKKNMAVIQSKNQSAIKESSANKLIETKLRIYESCDNGIITEEDKNNYLSILEESSNNAIVIGYRFDCKTVIGNKIDTIIRDKLGDEETNFYILSPGYDDKINYNDTPVYIPDKNSISKCLIITNTKNNGFILSVLKSKNIKFTIIRKPEKEILKDWSKVCKEFKTIKK